MKRIFSINRPFVFRQVPDVEVWDILHITKDPDDDEIHIGNVGWSHVRNKHCFAPGVSETFTPAELQTIIKFCQIATNRYKRERRKKEKTLAK